MTSQEPPYEPDETPEDTGVEPQRGRRARPQPRRPEPNPALDPRLARLEGKAEPVARTVDTSLLAVGLIAFVFGVAMHFWVATSVLSGGDSTSTSNEPVATATVETEVVATATVEAVPTSTQSPDRTNCDEIRGTQYRSVTEREFFLANCTGSEEQAPAPTEPAAAPTATTQP